MSHLAPTRKGALALALASGMLLLSGCLSGPSSTLDDASIPDGLGARMNSGPAPAVVDPAAAAEVPIELTFEAGDSLEEGSIFAEWTDPFFGSEEFSILAPDDGNGQWSYTHDTNGCTVGFYQGTLDDVAPEPTDRESTISALAAITHGKDAQVTPEIVSTYGNEFPVDQQYGGTVSFWGLGADMTDGSSWVDSARYFNAVDGVFYFTVQCPAGTSAYDEHDQIIGPIGLSLSVVGAGE